MKKFLCFIILIIVFMLKIGEAKIEQKRPWFYISYLDVSIGIPPYWSLGCSRLAIGLPPPYGFGIGLTPFEFLGWSSDEQSAIVGQWLLNVYWVPYSNWCECGYYSKRIIYTYFSIPLAQEGFMGGEPDRYIKYGIGHHYGIEAKELPFGLLWGIEIGFYHYKGDWYYPPHSAFYLAVNLNFGLWLRSLK